MEDSKNRLYSLLQSQGKQRPIFSDEKSGLQHEPDWVSTVQLYDGSLHRGNKCKTKIDAQMSAASEALHYMENLPLSKFPKSPKTPKTVMLVDVENMPSFLRDLPEEYHNIDSLDIYACLGEHHSLSTQEFPKDIKKVLNPSTRPNGTDSYIQMLVGFFLSQERYDLYLIVTRDKFGDNIIELVCAQGMPWKSCAAGLITQYKHIDVHMKNRGHPIMTTTPLLEDQTNNLMALLSIHYKDGTPVIRKINF